MGRKRNRIRISATIVSDLKRRIIELQETLKEKEQLIQESSSLMVTMIRIIGRKDQEIEDFKVPALNTKEE